VFRKIRIFVLSKLLNKENTLIMVTLGIKEPSDSVLFPDFEQNLGGYKFRGDRAVGNCGMITCNRRELTSVN
jgi:hypothetical protein